MDVRLYILAATFLVMVVSLITVVVIIARIRRREKPVSLAHLPPLPPPATPQPRRVDTDLTGLEVPVPENSPHAALLRPLAERPVWGGAEDRVPAPVREPIPPPPSPDTAVVRDSTSTPTTPPESEVPSPPETSAVPALGSAEVRHLATAEEILASLEAEIAEASSGAGAVVGEELAAATPQTTQQTTEVSASSAAVGPDAVGADAIAGRLTESEPEAPEASTTGVTEFGAAAAEAADADEEATGTTAMPSAPPAAATSAAAGKVVRETAASRSTEPVPVLPGTTAGSSRAIRVAGIRVRVAPDDQPPVVDGHADAPEIVLSSPVEMWFGDHRVGVRKGTPTFARLQRYAETMLSDLRAAREQPPD